MSPFALLAVLVFTVSIFSYQISKIYAQSKRSNFGNNSLVVEGNATLQREVSARKIGIGVSNPTKALEVNGNANFWGIIHGVNSDSSHHNAVVTVAYANQKIDQYLKNLVVPPEPPDTDCYEIEEPVPYCNFNQNPYLPPCDPDYYQRGPINFDDYGGGGCYVSKSCCKFPEPLTCQWVEKPVTYAGLVSDLSTSGICSTGWSPMTYYRSQSRGTTCTLNVQCCF